MIVEPGGNATISNIKIKRRRSGTTIERQVRACERDAENLDNQPHMTLSPEKDGKPLTEGHPQAPCLLSAREAHRQGFHAGARWARRDEQRRQQMKCEVAK